MPWQGLCKISLAEMDNGSPPTGSINIMNLRFPSPVGLAAGFDRDGKLITALNPVGFGFIEIGTININSEMAPDDPVNPIIQNIKTARNNSSNKALIGVSLGSKRDRIDKHTVNDYLQGMRLFWDYSDYIVVNLRGPANPALSVAPKNTGLGNLLGQIKSSSTALGKDQDHPVPVLIKTTITRERVNVLPEALIRACELEFDGLLVAFENGSSTNDVIEVMHEISLLAPRLPLIIVGGIKTAQNAFEILNAGARLVQCYTLLAEQGPVYTKKMIQEAIQLMKYE